MRSVRVPKVLAVDDRRANLIALEAILGGLTIELHTADSGERALKRLLADDYAAILLDAQMPGMDGFETARHIKQRPRTRFIPIIFLTAADYDARLAAQGYQAGAVDYLTKPFDPWILRSKVSVFADLWLAHTELETQAREYVRLRHAVDQALDTLEDPHQEPNGAAAVLRAARARPVGTVSR